MCASMHREPLFSRPFKDERARNSRNSRNLCVDRRVEDKRGHRTISVEGVCEFDAIHRLAGKPNGVALVADLNVASMRTPQSLLGMLIKCALGTSAARRIRSACTSHVQNESELQTEYSRSRAATQSNDKWRSFIATRRIGNRLRKPNARGTKTPLRKAWKPSAAVF